jgi:hypothetical protein
MPRFSKRFILRQTVDLLYPVVLARSSRALQKGRVFLLASDFILYEI